MDGADITYTTPGRKDHVYVGKLDGVKQYSQKKYLLWTIIDILQIANGNQEVVFDENTFHESFGKKLTYRQLYYFLKFHKQYVFNINIPQASCLCEICENVVFVAKGINKSLTSNEKALPTNPHDIVEKLSCDSSSKSCMLGTCEVCGECNLSIDDFKNGDNTISSCSDVVASDEDDKWGRGDDGKVKKVLANVEVFNQQLCTLKRHIYTKREQVNVYNAIKNEIKPGELLIHVDYSENYENRQQNEIQSAYFGHTTFSLFTACCYLRKEVDGELVKENVTTQESLHFPV